MSQKLTTRKSVRFSETPLVRQYSNDFSADRKANSQTRTERSNAMYLSKIEDRVDKLTKQLAKEEEQKRNTRPEDAIQITRNPTISFSVNPQPKPKKGALHKFKKMLGITKGGRKKNRGTRKKRSKRTRKNRYH